MLNLGVMADGFPHSDDESGNNPQADEKPPFSIDAERAILGAILFDNEIFYRVNSYLKAEHFYDPVHELVFDACQTLINQGRLASPVVIDSFCSKSPGFVEAGGRRYLEQLAASVPSTVSAHDYARLVFDLAVRRGLMAVGAAMIDRARDAEIHDEPARQLEEAEQALYKLAETGKFGGGFKTFRKAMAESIDIAHEAINRDGGLAGISTGLRNLDEKLGGLQRSDLIILAARPAMGKSSLAVNIAVNAALAHKSERQEDGSMKTTEGAIVGLFSLEMAAEQLATRIISERTGISSSDIRRGEISQEDFDRIYHESKRIESLPLYIDDTGGIALAQLAARARRLKRQHGLDLLIVDYLQLLTGSGKRSDNRVQEITEISMGLKALAKELNVPVIALSQLSRQVENRDDKRPQLADLRESGSIEQDADVVMFIFREEYYLSRQQPREGTETHAQWMIDCERAHGVAELIIAKQRHGPISTAYLQFEEKLTRFSDLDDGRYEQHRRDGF